MSAPEEFSPFLQGLQSNQALVHGINDYNETVILSGKRLKTKAGEEPERTKKEGLPIIARSKDFFRYPDGPGLLMLDHDKARNITQLRLMTGHCGHTAQKSL